MSNIKKLRINVDGKDYQVEVELFESTPAASAAPAAASPAPAPAAAAPAPAASPAPAAPTGSGAPGEVLSPLSGKVVEVDIEAGAEVTEGDQIITLEAMKMNTFVTAPKSGKVTEVLIAPGDAVDEGQLLAKID
ncbi:MAG: acetyl-CoA carboxylase biotin carboxyl carrier protein subunit [Verrucomicrobiota bacterium]